MNKKSMIGKIVIYKAGSTLPVEEHLDDICIILNKNSFKYIKMDYYSVYFSNEYIYDKIFSIATDEMKEIL